ncbi:MAG: cytidylate kinase-like family protein [Lachnospiraceae bacterium]|nr:cytidylate kinase-like family protein [Candidatus Colinaster equi]
MRNVVTISREYGAGGGTIGHYVSDRMGLEYLDKAIILTTANEAQVSVESALKLDELAPTNFGFAQSLFDFYNKPLNEKLFEAQSEIIKLFGERGNCIIVGRNANSILKEFDNCLHVFISADIDFRIDRMLKKEMYAGISRNKMAELINTVDKRRRKYCEYYTNTVFGDSHNYDLCLDSSKLGIDTCVDIICSLVEGK